MSGFFPDFERFKQDLQADKKVLLDRLEKIELNTRPSFPPSNFPFLFKISSETPLIDSVFEVRAPYLIYLGVCNILSDPFFADIGGRTTIRFDKSQEPILIRPSTVVKTPYTKNPVTAFFSSTNALVGSSFHYFLQLQKSEDFEDWQRHIPFQRFSDNFIKRAMLDNNDDQYVVFRNAPTVNISNTGTVKIWDGTDTALVSATGQLEVHLSQPSIVVQDYVTAVKQGTAGPAAALTVTLAVIGSFIELLYLEVEAYSTAARTGGATPVTVDISGFQDDGGAAVTMHWKFQTAAAVGTTERKVMNPAELLRGKASTNIVISCPNTASVIWQVNVGYRWEN